MLSYLIELIRALLPRIQTQAERDEAYLSAAVDLNDLERRMRQIEAPTGTPGGGLRFSQTLR